MTPGKEEKKKKERDDNRMSKSHHIVVIGKANVFADFVKANNSMNKLIVSATRHVQRV
jgi:hypothetical protein